jgi:hypothetical protein
MFLKAIESARMIGLALAGLSIVFLGFKYLTGSANEDAALVKLAKNVLIAVVALWFISPIITLGKTVAKDYVWNPEPGQHGMESVDSLKEKEKTSF